MKYRKLGKTGMNVSVIGVGTWQLGGEWGKSYSQAEVDAIFDAAREASINLIDTAECYGDHLAESLVGQAIQRDRERWIVATKFGHKFHGYLNRTEDYSATAMVRQLEESLQALQTDYIDLYQVHGVSYLTARDNVLWDELERQRERGRIRAIGVSIRHDPALLERKSIQVAQILYNRLNRGAEETVFPVCLERGRRMGFGGCVGSRKFLQFLPAGCVLCGVSAVDRRLDDHRARLHLHA
jgi:aryl-alcohol dehydrogenase-like predicted oxidoreductase